VTAVVGVFVHPKACPCEGAKRMRFTSVRYRDGVVTVPAVGAVVDCPHCTDARGVLSLLPEGGPDLGGAA